MDLKTRIDAARERGCRKPLAECGIDVGGYRADLAGHLERHDYENPKAIYRGMNTEVRQYEAKCLKGEYVCKYGKTTHAGCDNIETKYYQISPQTGNKWVLVANEHGVVLADQGDSGGLFFSGNVGYGILTHDVDVDKVIYMAFSFIENKGLSLDTD